MDALSLDQFSVFVAVVEDGSFAAAARRLGRAQSAITYTIQKLEEQSGLTLFDRSAYRPTLTEAGHALLPRAQRVLEAVGDYRLQVRGISNGLEAELSIVIDAFVSVEPIASTLQAFQETFPRVNLRILVEWHDQALRTLLEGPADLGLLIEYAALPATLKRNFCGEVDLVPVASPQHPLARVKGVIEPDLLRDSLQLVLIDRSSPRNRRDFGVVAANRWHVTGHQTKHALLLAGIGWGSMPRPIVAADIASGRLVELHPARWEGADRMPRFAFSVAHRSDKALGPAGRWLMNRLSTKEASDGRPSALAKTGTSTVKSKRRRTRPDPSRPSR